MKTMLFVLLAALLTTSFTAEEKLTLTTEEAQLYRLLIEYRKQKNLPAIPLSYSLCKVAKLHVNDLANNNPTTAKCNLHSWSKAGNWQSCCYTDNHKEAECMWNKPRELSKYTGDGFEIAAHLGENATAQGALNGWKSSAGHNAVIVNQGSWKDMNWKAVGVGIEDGYAVIWFGVEEDPENTELISSN